MRAAMYAARHAVFVGPGKLPGELREVLHRRAGAPQPDIAIQVPRLLALFDSAAEAERVASQLQRLKLGAMVAGPEQPPIETTWAVARSLEFFDGRWRATTEQAESVTIDPGAITAVTQVDWRPVDGPADRAVLLTVHFLQYESFGNAVWFGIFHAVSAFCNAGFDLQGDFRSLADHSNSPLALIGIGGLIQFGAISYMVAADVWNQRQWKRLQLDTNLVLIMNFLLIFASALLFLVVEWQSAMVNVSNAWKPMDALFQGVAARTAGFSSVDWSQAHASTLYLWVAVMLVGGAAGSTAGGIKLATLAVIILAVISTLRGQDEPQAFGRRIGVTVVFRALAISVMFLLTHFALALMLVLSEDIWNHQEFSFVALMFEAMSALATVGLSTGLTPDLSATGKVILCVGMFIGRLGPITAAYALQSRQQPRRYRFPEAQIRLG